MRAKSVPFAALNYLRASDAELAVTSDVLVPVDIVSEEVSRAATLEQVATATNLIGSATPVSSVTPTHIGQEYFDTTATNWYKAVGLTNADWKQITA